MNEINQIHLLDHFKNPEKKNEYLIKIKVPEFTCLCPKTGQPDFAILYINYIPDKLCIELKSLKLYVASFRQIGAFHEAVTNQICNDLTKIIAPNYLKVKAKFNVRGGIFTTVESFKIADNWCDSKNLI
jgi:7-cyano-7-deazaguanine reductase